MSEDEKSTYTIIPATPGWEFAVFCGEPAILLYEPIIAWEIERHERPYDPVARRYGEMCVNRFATPIMASGDDDNIGNLWAIKRPDGKFELPFDRTIDTEDALLTYFVEQEAKQRKQKAEAAARKAAQAEAKKASTTDG
jgi:hypothetical protein